MQGQCALCGLIIETRKDYDYKSAMVIHIARAHPMAYYDAIGKMPDLELLMLEEAWAHSVQKLR